MSEPAALSRSRRAFMDSDGYLALLDEDDEHHAEAEQIIASLGRNRYRQFTTNAVLFESHALILSRLGIQAALRFLHDVQSGSTVIVRVAARDEARAQAILRSYTDRRFSYTDALSFAVMERLCISEAFAFDRHFVQYGFQRLIP